MVRTSSTTRIRRPSRSPPPTAQRGATRPVARPARSCRARGRPPRWRRGRMRGIRSSDATIRAISPAWSIPRRIRRRVGMGTGQAASVDRHVHPIPRTRWARRVPSSSAASMSRRYLQSRTRLRSLPDNSPSRTTRSAAAARPRHREQGLRGSPGATLDPHRSHDSSRRGDPSTIRVDEGPTSHSDSSRERIDRISGGTRMPQGSRASSRDARGDAKWRRCRAKRRGRPASPSWEAPEDQIPPTMRPRCMPPSPAMQGSLRAKRRRSPRAPR